MTHFMVLKIAARNVFLHRMRTLVVGSILTFGAFLAVVGHSFVNGVSGGMENSTTQSITGDIQIYSEKAKDKLSVFGNMDGSPVDVGHLDSFENVSNRLMQNTDVAAVVPMGTSFATVNPGNILDHFLETLRKTFKDPQADPKDLESQKRRIRFLVQEIKKNLEGKFEEIGILSAADVEQAKINLEQVSRDTFWQDFNSQFESKIEFLANKIAPLIFDDNMIFFSYVGTDPQLFQQKFPQFEIVKGEMIPAGTRGFLFHDYFYENMVKHRIARRLDQIKKKMKDDKLTIAGSKELQDQIKANVEQSAEIYLQLGPVETETVSTKLMQLLSSQEKDFRVLIKNFLDMNDQSFQTRYEFFYKEIAPYVVLYRVKIGDVLPLSAFTKSGTSTAVNIKVYGTFRFKSFENSPLAGNFSLMDLVSLRELYGFMTEERRAQNKQIEDEMGLNDIGQDAIENLFSSSSGARPEKTSAAKKSENVELSFKKRIMGATYTPDELNKGVFLHAAVFLKDPGRRDAVIKDIMAISKQEGLGIQAVSWQDAAGFIGQMTFMMKAILNIFIGIALLLAGLMIMNSLLMAAMDRKQEIGTMRAIGAHADFIYRLFFYETLFISLLFGGVGVILGSLVVVIIGAVGIPASGDVATFFFSGPRLYLHLNPGLVFTVIAVMVVIAILATQYPAWKAMKISPLQAMQKRE
ncbi:MAG: ABC transporter permease [Bdellovibrionaceae bacterium]|nr:ABC transporter permease [Pseudobdellovibrionaceae bacterium]